MSDLSRKLDELEVLIKQLTTTMLDGVGTIRDGVKYLENIKERLTSIKLQPIRPHPTIAAPRNGASASSHRGLRQTSTGVRSKVLSVISERWATVAEIVAATGLNRNQVQGVLFARDLTKKGAIKKERVEGKSAFKYRLKEEAAMS